MKSLRGGRKRRCRQHRGGSGCGPGGCPIAPFKMGGGSGGSGLSSMSYGSNFVMPNTSSGILGVGQSGGCDGQCGITPPSSAIAMGGGGASGWNSGSTQAFVGKPWTATKWPGSDGIEGDRNYYSLNTYKTDPQTMMKLKGGWKIRSAAPAVSSRTTRHRRSRHRRYRSYSSRYSRSRSSHSSRSRSRSKHSRLSSHVSMTHNNSTLLNSNSDSEKYTRKNRRSRRNRRSKNKQRSQRKRVRGGGWASYMPQDIVNGARGVEYNATNAYRTYYAESPAVNPLPFKDQYMLRK